jgi:O-antigen/teichoic acid export membrane protein
VLGVLSVIFTLPLVWRYGLYGAVLVPIIVEFFSIVLSRRALVEQCRKHGISPRFTWPNSTEWRILAHYSFPSMAGSLLTVPVTWLVNVLLVRSHRASGTGYAELGVVNVVNSLRLMVNYIPAILLAPALSIMANSLDQPAKLSKTLRYCLTMSSLCVLPLSLAIVVMGKYVLHLLYGAQYAGSTTMLAWAMVVAGIYGAGAGLGNVINATGRMWLGFSINAFWGIAFLVLAWFLIPRYGGNGYMGAMGVSYIALNAVFIVGFILLAPGLLAGYPFLRVLMVFLVLAAAAASAAPRMGLLACIFSAAALAGVMAGVIVVAQRRSNRGHALGPASLLAAMLPEAA